MYADDLILITTATRKSAINVILGLDLCSSLSFQKTNTSKLEVYFPI